MMAQKYLFFLIINVFLVSLAAYGQNDYITPIPTNEEVVADETARLLLKHMNEKSAGPDFNAGISRPVYLDVAVPARVHARLQSNLLGEGVRVAADPDGYQSIRIQWDADNILEELRGGISRRIIRVDLYFSLLDADREIQKTWESSFVWEDEIPADQVALLEGSWEAAAFHEKKEAGRRTFIRRIAEPAVITGAVAVTIYLLYNVRS